MRALKIWHHGIGPQRDAVNGVNQTVWALAQAQAARGHSVLLLTRGNPSQVREARRHGLWLLDHSSYPDERPDVVHMHSVFMPSQRQLMSWALKRSVPYVVTPHGGVAPQVLNRRWMRKVPYIYGIERPRFRRASGITAVTSSEVAEIRQFMREDLHAVSVIPNAVTLPPGDVPSTAVEDLVFLGRLDAEHKGLDRLCAIATALPEFTFGIYGSRTKNSLPSFPPNVVLHGPVYGDRKWSILKGAKAYIQLSRWEAFGLPICEAALVGTPQVVAVGMHLAPLVQSWGGLALDMSRPNERVSLQLREFLEGIDGSQAESMSLHARDVVDPELVSAGFDDFYRRMISGC